MNAGIVKAIAITLFLIILVGLVGWAIVEKAPPTLEKFQTFAAGVVALITAIIGVSGVIINQIHQKNQRNEEIDILNKKENLINYRTERVSAAVLLGYISRIERFMPADKVAIGYFGGEIGVEYYNSNAIYNVPTPVAWYYLHAVNSAAGFFNIASKIDNTTNDKVIEKVEQYRMDVKKYLAFSYEILNQISSNHVNSRDDHPKPMSEHQVLQLIIEADPAQPADSGSKTSEDPFTQQFPE
ncbi:hypothetical protein [Thalassobaculum litoreum]|uniref:Uncharacterized protein n=1 Tax=Thalassobaculum litoreum DSM 18839 TaxID=1123362 RepID=A0A8G2EWU0_9PROT|nr:hypothetical protein [Thalassobaculum litoreum]SDF12176.1 hypothetical protein SAMN05660686_00343 [Thalassobaculum litoreum DSM 18839]